MTEMYKSPSFGEVETMEEWKDRMKQTLIKMRAANSMFYLGAAASGCHPFIEFCGVQSKYIDMCQELFNAGLDFTEMDVHSGLDAAVEFYHLEYLSEKLSCILAPFFRGKPEALLDFERRFRAKLGMALPE